jgi:retinol-binding protein 3
MKPQTFERSRAAHGRQTGLLPIRAMAVGAILAGVFLVSLALLPSPARAQGGPLQKGQLPAMDQRLQAAVLDSISAVMDTMYVLHDVASKTVSRWKKEFKRGAYRSLTDPVDFVQRLQEDADAVYRNKHFGMIVLQPFDPATEGEKEVDPRESQRALRAARRGNFGFRKAEILPGNIGYLRLDQFAGTDEAAETAIGAMNFLGNADALIFDLRNNGGGDAAMIRLLATYLFKDQQHLIDWYVRDIEETVQSWTLDYVPGRRLAEIPVYVLTSDFTASAAEEFTFDLQHLKRATIVGDTTAGAGHTVNTVFIHFDKFRVGMRVPYGNAMDPRTGKGWEGPGVIPDIAVPREKALLAAQVDALQRLKEKSASPDDSLAIAWTLAEFECQVNPIVLDREKLGEYAGSYGPRRILLEGEILQYQRQGRPKLPLVPVGKDLFRVGELDNFRLRFDRDASGRITGLTGLYNDGRQESNPREG